MAGVLVDTPLSAPSLPKAALNDAIPDIDPLEGSTNDEDGYSILKRYQRHLEYVLGGISTTMFGKLLTLC